MSHPNPYLFQISRRVFLARNRMDNSASDRPYPLQDVRDFKDVFSIFWTSSRVYLFVLTLIVI
jgi:hypothetical protein